VWGSLPQRCPSWTGFRILSSRLCFGSVVQAVEYAIAELTERGRADGRRGVGEDVGSEETERTLCEGRRGLTKAVNQAGLFVTLAAQDIVRDRILSDVSSKTLGFSILRKEIAPSVCSPSCIRTFPSQASHRRRSPGTFRGFTSRLWAVIGERDELQSLVLDRGLVTITVPGSGNDDGDACRSQSGR